MESALRDAYADTEECLRQASSGKSSGFVWGLGCKTKRNYLAGEEALSNVQGNASQSQERKILEI